MATHHPTIQSTRHACLQAQAVSKHCCGLNQGIGEVRLITLKLTIISPLIISNPAVRFPIKILVITI